MDESQNPNVDKSLDADFLRRVKEMSDEAEASQKEGRQLGLGLTDDEGAADEAPDLAVADLQNPNLSHRLYYTIQRLLIDGLPRGKANEELRRYVYDEKNLYINRGMDLDVNGIRGSDGRMGYIPHLKRALKMVKQWVADGGSAFDVFIEFWTLNESLGYHLPKGERREKPGPPSDYEEPLSIQGTLDDVLRAAVSDDDAEEPDAD